MNRSYRDRDRSSRRDINCNIFYLNSQNSSSHNIKYTSEQINTPSRESDSYNTNQMNIQKRQLEQCKDKVNYLNKLMGDTDRYIDYRQPVHNKWYRQQQWMSQSDYAKMNDFYQQKNQVYQSNNDLKLESTKSIGNYSSMRPDDNKKTVAINQQVREELDQKERELEEQRMLWKQMQAAMDCMNKEKEVLMGHNALLRKQLEDV